MDIVQKMHKLCLIMLINASSNCFFLIIFDLRITIPRVHPVQSSSRSGYCITTDIIGQTPKMPGKLVSNK